VSLFGSIGCPFSAFLFGFGAFSAGISLFTIPFRHFSAFAKISWTIALVVSTTLVSAGRIDLSDVIKFAIKVRWNPPRNDF
jgi:hypothetical protein